MSEYDKNFSPNRHVKVRKNLLGDVESGKIESIGDLGLLGLMILRWKREREKVFFHQMHGWYDL